MQRLLFNVHELVKSFTYFCLSNAQIRVVYSTASLRHVKFLF